MEKYIFIVHTNPVNISILNNSRAFHINDYHLLHNAQNNNYLRTKIQLDHTNQSITYFLPPNIKTTN